MLKSLFNKIISNKLILVIALLFIVWKFFLIHTMWDGRAMPPTPSDSFVYIAHIDSVIQCPSFLFCNAPYSLSNFNGWEHLSYRFFFGSIGKLFHLPASLTYYYSFYIGILLLVPSLIYFTKKITKNTHLASLILLFLLLYNGAGSYHGFFWVVPSFFSVLLFFFMIGIVLGENKHWKYTLPLLALTASLNHIMSVYSSVIFLLYFMLNSITHRSINKTLLKKISVIIIFAALPYLFLTFLLQNNPYKIASLNKRSIPETHLTQPNVSLLNDASSILPQANSLNTTTSYLPQKLFLTKNYTTNYLPGLKLVKLNYLNWLFPNIFGVLLFVIITSSILYFKKYKILHLYLATFIFTLLSTKSMHGVRALVFLWPITLVFYAYGTYYFFKILHKQTTTNIYLNLLTTLLSILLLLLFILLNLSYSYILNTEINSTENIDIPSILTTILTTTEPRPYCKSTTISLYPVNDISKIHCNIHDIRKSNMFITFMKRTNDSILQQVITKIKRTAPPESLEKVHDTIPAEFVLKERLGDILIYTRK